MKIIEHIHEFLDVFLSWASDQPDVQGIAQVGSYARGTAGDASDIDLVILMEDPSEDMNTKSIMLRNVILRRIVSTLLLSRGPAESSGGSPQRLHPARLIG